MKNKFLRLLALLLLSSIIISCVSCTASIPEETTAGSNGVTTQSPETEPLSFSITADYKLVRADEADQQEVKAIQLLARGIKSACGVTCQMITDFKKPTEELKRNEFEILVGVTNRDESIALSDGLAYYDWEYRVYSKNVIAICGGSPEATYNAVEQFLADVLGYKENAETQEVISAGSANTIDTTVQDALSYTYPVTSLKIGSHDISEFSLVTAYSKLSGINEIVYSISRLCGKNIPIVTLEDYKGGPAIFLGCAKPDGSHREAAAYGRYRYFISEADGNIFIDFTTKSVCADAVQRFIHEYIPGKASGELTITLDGGEPLTGLSITSGTNGLLIEERTSKEVAPGVSYEEHLYLDKNGKPIRAYMMIIKKGAATIETTMPSDNAENIGKVSNMKNQLNAAINNGKKAIAAVNADFFDMGGTNIMRGLCIKDGVFVHGTGDRPWFGITADGEAVMGTGEEYANYKDKLVTAVGGSHVILRNDNPDNLSVGTEFADTRHPRTAVGVTPDGTIVLLIVDGRQPETSNGASLADLAEILGLLGCSRGINLDGGGSSTLILKEGSNLNTKNSPSAGSLRAVANGLMVVLP